MKVAVYYSNTDIRIEERPVPDIADKEVLVKMHASGICGTDVMEWYRMKKAPRVLGHEMSGTVVATGPGVNSLRKGDRVFVSHHVPCYQCHYCTDWNYTACDFLHAGNYDPGGFAEFIRVPAENVESGTLILPDTVSDEEAVMIEPLACVLSGQKLKEPKKGQTVLVIGSGVSGILHIQSAKIRGATVIATDIDPYKLEMAREFGADATFQNSGFSSDDLRTINDGRLADQVIVCAGAQEAVDAAFASVDRKGWILLFAIPGKDIVIPALRLWRDEITVTSSYGASPDDLRNALHLIADGRVSVRRMITHKVPLSNISEGFRIVARSAHSLKVVVVPDS